MTSCGRSGGEQRRFFWLVTEQATTDVNDKGQSCRYDRCLWLNDEASPPSFAFSTIMTHEAYCFLALCYFGDLPALFITVIYAFRREAMKPSVLIHYIPCDTRHHEVTRTKQLGASRLTCSYNLRRVLSMCGIVRMTYALLESINSTLANLLCEPRLGVPTA